METSAYMQSVQEQKLGSLQNITLHWHNSIAEVKPSSEAFTFLVAHEFFDALPVYLIRVSLSLKMKKLIFIYMLDH